jgi:hypothetical protein
MQTIEAARKNNKKSCGHLEKGKMDQEKEIDTRLPVTLSVPLFGWAAFDLGESSSYEAAKTGAIRTVEVRGKKKVPVRAELNRLAGGDPTVLAALAKDFLFKLKEAPAAEQSAAA